MDHTEYPFLNDLEKSKLEQFAEDADMKEAVRKVILSTIYQRGVLKKGEKADAMKNFLLVFASQNLDADNAVLGAQLRARYEGINFVELGFGLLDTFKRQPAPTPNQGRNKAR